MRLDWQVLGVGRHRIEMTGVRVLSVRAQYKVGGKWNSSAGLNYEVFGSSTT